VVWNLRDPWTTIAEQVFRLASTVFESNVGLWSPTCGRSSSRGVGLRSPVLSQVPSGSNLAVPWRIRKVLRESATIKHMDLNESIDAANWLMLEGRDVPWLLRSQSERRSRPTVLGVGTVQWRVEQVDLRRVRP
jgi:hypothetical protein